jgi:hypothetical protein
VTLRQNQIESGKTANFRVVFPDIPVYGSVEFTVTSSS